MTRLLHAELLKIRTVRTFLWLSLASVALVTIACVSVTASSGTHDDRGTAQIAGVSLVFALIGGIMIFAGEATHGTITQALLVTPVRERVLLAKAVVAALLGLVLAVAAEVLVLAITIPGASLDVHNARRVLIGVLIGAPLVGALGAGFGALVHAQGAAIGMSLVWLLVGENIVRVISQSVSKYTPGNAFAALASGSTHGSPDMLGMAAGGVTAAVWAGAFLTAGVLALLGRDI